MRRIYSPLIIGSIVAVFALCVGVAAPNSAQKSSEIEQLQREIATVRQVADSLEERLKEDVLVPTPKDGFIVPGFQSRRVPANWRRFEFNGMTFYIVPIDNPHAPVGEADKQVPRSLSPATPKTAVNE